MCSSVAFRGICGPRGVTEMARAVCTLCGKRLDGGVSVLSVGVNPFWS
jgi:hypothetical protein